VKKELFLQRTKLRTRVC